MRMTLLNMVFNSVSFGLSAVCGTCLPGGCAVATHFQGDWTESAEGDPSGGRSVMSVPTGTIEDHGRDCPLVRTNPTSPWIATITDEHSTSGEADRSRQKNFRLS
jgi:hypothetical protein